MFVWLCRGGVGGWVDMGVGRGGGSFTCPAFTLSWRGVNPSSFGWLIIALLSRSSGWVGGWVGWMECFVGGLEKSHPPTRSPQ